MTVETSMELTDLAKRLLEVLEETGQPMSRRDIAKSLGRPGILLPYDVSTLEALAAAGLINITQVIVGAVRKEYRYGMSDRGSSSKAG